MMSTASRSIVVAIVLLFGNAEACPRTAVVTALFESSPAFFDGPERDLASGVTCPFFLADFTRASFLQRSDTAGDKNLFRCT